MRVGAFVREQRTQATNCSGAKPRAPAALSSSSDNAPTPSGTAFINFPAPRLL